MVTYSMERPSRLASVWRSNSTSWVKADLFFHKALSEFFKDRLKINILGSTKRNINRKLLKKERKSRNFQTFGEGVVFFQERLEERAERDTKMQNFSFWLSFFQICPNKRIFFPNKPFLSVAMNIVKRKKTLCRLHFKY